MIKTAKWILAMSLALALTVGMVACGGDDADSNGSGETTAAETTPAPSEGGGATGGQGDGTSDGGAADGPARSEQIDELLGMHPVFPAKRYMNFAARGNPGACSLLSDKGRKAMERAHGKPCPAVIRAAAAERTEPGLTIAGEFVPVDGFSDLEYPTTILVFDREQGRVTVGDEPRPMVLRRYGKIWLIDSIPFADVGTVR